MKNLHSNPFVQQKVHYKLVKSTKGWLTIGLTTLGLATAMLFSVPQIQADTTAVSSVAADSASTQSSVNETNKDQTGSTSSLPKQSASSNSQSASSSEAAQSGSEETSKNSAVDIHSTSNSSANNANQNSISQNETTVASSSVALNDNKPASVGKRASVLASSIESTSSNESKSTAETQSSTIQTSSAVVGSASSANDSATASVHAKENKRAVNLELLDTSSAESVSNQTTNGDEIISFQNIDGTVNKALTQVIKQGTNVTKPLSNPVLSVPNDGRGGAEQFNGWFYKTSDGVSGTPFNFDQPVFNSATLVPVFTRMFNVKFNYPRNNGTEADGTDVTHIVAENSTISTPNKIPVADTGQRFIYWYDANTDSNKVLLEKRKAPDAYVFGVNKVTHDFELTSYFADAHTVTFHNTEGVPVAPQLVATGSLVNEPSIDRAGYKFIGWTANNSQTVTSANYEQNKFDFTKLINTDTDLYGVWEPQEVSYNLVYWVEKLDENGNPYPEMIDKVTYEVVGKVAYSQTALTDSFVSLNTDDFEVEDDFTILQDSKKDPADAIHFASIAKIDQNVQISGNGQTSINVYCNLNSYTFNFDFTSGKNYVYQFYGTDGYGHYGLFTPLEDINTNHLYVEQSPNLSQQVYTIHAKYGQNVSSEWPIIHNGDQAYDDWQYVTFGGWNDGSSTNWATKRVNLTQDMLTNVKDSVVTLKPFFVDSENANSAITQYYLESLDAKTKYYNSITHKYYDLLTDYNDRFKMVGTKLLSKQIPGTPTVGTTDNKGTSGQDVNGTLIFKMYYDRETYNFMLDNNDGSGIKTTKQIKFGASITKDNLATIPTRAGYTFDGWYVDANGTQPFLQSGQYEFSTMPPRDVTLFAKWTETKYHIHYYADYNDMINGKELTAVAPQVYGLDDEFVRPDTFVAGSTIDPDRGRFLAWNYMNGSDAVAMNDKTLITQDYKLFGSYDSVHFNIAYSVSEQHNGPVKDESNYGLGTTVRLADKPDHWSANPDQIFLGWSYTKNGKEIDYLPGDFVKVDHNLVTVSADSPDQTLTFNERYTTTASAIYVTFVPNDPNNPQLTSKTIPAEKNKTTPAVTQSELNDFELPLLGWSLSSTLIPSMKDISTGSANMSVYGHWLKITISGSKVYNGSGTESANDTDYKVILDDVSGSSTTQLDPTLVSFNGNDFTRIDNPNVGTYDDLKLNQSGLKKIEMAYADYDFSNVNLSELKSGKFTILPDPINAVTSQNGSRVYNGDAISSDHTSTDGSNFTSIAFTVNSGDTAAAPMAVTLEAATDFDYTDATGQVVLPTNLKNVGRYAWKVNTLGLTKLYSDFGSKTGVADDANYSLNTAQLTGEYLITAQPLTTPTDPNKPDKPVNSDRPGQNPQLQTSVVLQGGTKVYDNDATTDPTTFTVIGPSQYTDFTVPALTADDFDLIGITSQNVGNYQVKLTASGLKKIQDANANYKLDEIDIQNGIFSITAQPLTTPTDPNEPDKPTNPTNPGDNPQLETSVVLQGGTKVYDGDAATDPTTFKVIGPSQYKNFTIPTLVGADFDLTGITSQDVGNYQVKLTAAGLKKIQDANKNYTLDNSDIQNGIFSITPAPVTITPVSGLPAVIDSQTKVYDNDASTDPTLYTVKLGTGLKAPVWTASDFDLSGITSQNVGQYKVTLSAQGLTDLQAANTNYTLTSADVVAGNFNITPAPISITAPTLTKVYDGQPYPGKDNVATVKGVPAKWVAAVYAMTDIAGDVNVGNYPMTITTKTGDNSNYTVTINPGKLAITQQDLTIPTDPNEPGKPVNPDKPGQNPQLQTSVVLQGGTKVYDGDSATDPTTFTVIGPSQYQDFTVPTLTADDFDLTGINSQNVGNYQVKLTAAGLKKIQDANTNYKLDGTDVQNGIFTITQANATVSFAVSDKLSKVYDGKKIDYLPTIQLTTKNNSSQPKHGELELIVADNNDVDLDSLLTPVELVSGDYQIAGKSDLSDAGDYQIRLTDQGIKHIQSDNPNFSFSSSDLEKLTQTYTILKRSVSVTVDQIPTRIPVNQVEYVHPSVTVSSGLSNEPVLYSVVGVPKLDIHQNALPGKYQLEVQVENPNSNYDYQLHGTELIIVPISGVKLSDAIYANETTVDFVDQSNQETVKTLMVADNPGVTHDVFADIPNGYQLVPGQKTSFVTPQQPGKIIMVMVTKVQPITPVEPSDGGKTVTPVVPVTPVKPDNGKKVVVPVKPDNGGETVKTDVPAVPSNPDNWDPIVVIIKTPNGNTITEHTVEGYVGTTVDISNLIPNGYHLVPGQSKELLLNDVTPQVILVEPDTPIVPVTDGPQGIDKGTGHAIQQIGAHTSNVHLNSLNDAHPVNMPRVAAPKGQYRKVVLIHTSHQRSVISPVNRESSRQTITQMNDKAIASSNVSVKSPKQSTKQSLPQTGEQQNSSLWAVLGLAMTTMLGWFGMARRKKETK